MSIKCQKCSSTDVIYEEQSHLNRYKVICASCKSYIKFEGKRTIEDPLFESCYSIDEQIKCVRREIGKRQGVYPRLVWEHKMKQETAEREIQLMMNVLSTLEGLKSN